ncbi:YphA family membrane protein [Rossellomorea sp. NS-SX7]|uniref:YphA family membrane protein n=1 Tax=Rossellomorea sp. NS-SX7 TaxID=3463856 RepID=UPI00405A4A5B
MEGIFFLWVAWGLWIYTTFMMRRNDRNRFTYSFILLCMICLFPYHVTLFSYEVYAAYIFLVVLTFIYIRLFGLRQKLYMLICILTIAMSYAGVGMIAIYDPVLMIIEPQVIAALLSMSLGFIFYSSIKKINVMFLSVLAGTMAGEVLLTVTLNKIGFGESVGDHLFLDMTACMALITITWKVIHALNALMSSKLSPNKGEIKNL